MYWESLLLFFRLLIIENFIPVEEKQKLMNRAYFDDDEETWRLRPLANKKYVICVLMNDSCIIPNDLTVSGLLSFILIHLYVCLYVHHAFCVSSLTSVPLKLNIEIYFKPHNIGQVRIWLLFFLWFQSCAS